MAEPTAEGVRQFLLAHLAEKLEAAGVDPETINDETDVLAMGVIDSLDVLEVITVVSDQFGVDDEWEDYEPEDILVIGPFCRYVQAHARDGLAREA